MAPSILSIISANTGRKWGSVPTSVSQTMLSTGRAMLIASLVLSSCLFSVISGTLKNTVVFGCFTGRVILIALLTDFMLLPALLIAALARGERR